MRTSAAPEDSRPHRRVQFDRSCLHPASSILAQYVVFEPLDFRHDSRFERFGALQAFARSVEQLRLGLLFGRQGLLFRARDYAGLIALPPFEFQMIHLTVELG